MTGKKNDKTAGVFSVIGGDLKDIGTTFAQGDFKTRLSFLIMGLGPLLRGQIVKGLAFLASELFFLWYITGLGMVYLGKLATLGTVETQKIHRRTIYGDNSFLILLFGILTIVIILAFLFIWRMNIRENREEERILRSGKKLPTNGTFLYSFLDHNFDKTLLHQLRCQPSGADQPVYLGGTGEF